MADIRYFHFTLGPVQGFVAQARRTRDFWAGSFLLSWLSAVAMKAVEEQTGRKDCIKFPKVDRVFLNYLSGKKAGTKPTQGSVPNRFKAEVHADFNPVDVVKSIHKAWQALADIIFEHDIKPYANAKTKAIWDTQIAHSWDISWVLCDDDTNSSAVDQRKNWRSYVFPAQAGVKCMMMADWQELSGINTPHSNGLRQFWQPLQTSKATMSSDLREGEHLCAIAFVKRRFVRYFARLKKFPMPNDWHLSGWELSPAMPSVAYIAAAHWLERAIKNADTEVFEDFYNAAYQLTGDLGEWSTRLQCLRGLGNKPHWTALDGNVFHPMALENINTYPDQVKAKKVLRKLNTLNQHINEKQQQDKQQQTSPSHSPLSPYYAILMMDGDSLGKHMSNCAKQSVITNSLEQFTAGVKNIVEQHNGVLIYAGGDDVLALLPLQDALPCATELRQHYLQCFAEQNQQEATKPEQRVFSTLSGAIEYAHIKIPLTKILYDVHHLLDQIAKEKTGRDSIAIRVQKPGGLVIEWSQPWAIALSNNTVAGKDPLIIETLADTFRKATESDSRFSSKFFYKIRERFNILNPVTNNNNVLLNPAVLDKNEDRIDLMCMEYLNSGKTTVTTMQDARVIIKPLLEQCRQVTRDEEETDREKWHRSQFLQANAALLVRFLANKGIER